MSVVKSTAQTKWIRILISSISLYLHISRSPVMRRQALLAYSCSHLEMLGGTASLRSSVPEILVCPCTSSRRDSSSDTTNSRALPSSGVTRDHQCSVAPGLHPVPCAHRRCGRDSRDSDSLLPLVRSHSEPGLSSSTDTGVHSVWMFVCACVHFILALYV